MNNLTEAIMVPELDYPWMDNGTVILVLLVAGIIAAPLAKLKWTFPNIIGYVLYGGLAIAWGWYVLARGYWDGGWFLSREAAPSLTDFILRWVVTVLFPLLTLICRPRLRRGNKIRLGQFNLLVILMGLAYAVALLMIRFWQLNTWATVVFAGLPALYVLLLLFSGVSAPTLLMSIPSAIVATLVAVSAIRQSMAVSMVFALVLDAALLVLAVVAFAKIGEYIPLADLKTSNTSSGGGSSIGKYDARADIQWKNWLDNQTLWK